MMHALKNNNIKIHNHLKRQQQDCNNVCYFIATQECMLHVGDAVFDKPGWHGH
jgi:hypothetical protein